MKNKLVKHLNDINETYIQHLIFASKISYKLLCASIILFIHAIFPFIFVKTASCMIKEINKIIKEREDNVKIKSCNNNSN